MRLHNYKKENIVRDSSSDKVFLDIQRELSEGKIPFLDDLKNKWGNKDVNKAIRELAKRGIAGVYRKRIYKVDFNKYRYAQGVVTQKGPNRFIFKDSNNQEAFLNGKSSKSVLDGDTLKCFIVKDSEGGLEALPVDLIQRDHKRMHVIRAKSADYFCLDNRADEIKVVTDLKEIKPGDFWFCNINDSSLIRDEVRAKIVSFIGNTADKGIESTLAYKTRFNEETKIKESDWPEQMSLADAFDNQNRKDLRAIPFVTIDGESSRDYDDAIAAIPNDDVEGGWKLWVAIADVSAFVGEGSVLSKQLDDLAKRKMTSVYLPHEVVPMLPNVVSNGVCSLNPNVDRFVLCCEMNVSSSGEITFFDFYRGLVSSHARLTYSGVQKFLDGDQTFNDQKVTSNIVALNALSIALRDYGLKQGRLDMGDDEVTYEFDQDGKIESLISSPRLWSHKLVEECMLAANKCAAQYLTESIGLGIFRNHLGMKVNNVPEVHQALALMGLKVNEGQVDITAKQISQVLDQAKVMGRYSQARSVMLGAMSSATYEEKNKGHFSLAAPYYCHFTSPIRRYPDLIIHKMIKSVIDGVEPPYTEDQLIKLAEQSSNNAQKASQAENEAKKLLMLNYMQKYIGKAFDSIVSSISERGLWVGLQIDKAKVEFFMPSKPLRDIGYKWEEPVQTWVNPDGVALTEGSEMRCKIFSVDHLSRRLDLIPEVSAELNLDAGLKSKINL